MPQFDAESCKRIANVVRDVEQSVRNGIDPTGRRAIDTTQVWVRCTTLTASSGFYAGKILVWDASAQTFTEGENCKLYPVAGGLALTDYIGTPAGYQSNEPVFMVQGGNGEIGVLDAQANANGGSATMSIHDDSGDSGANLTAYNFFATAVPSSTKVIVVWCNAAQRWYIAGANCP